MYLRTDTQPLKGGGSRQYLQFAHNRVMTMKNGQKRSKPVVFANLGAADDLDQDTVAGMLSALQRYYRKRFGGSAPPVEELATAAATLRQNEPAMRVLAGRSFGLRHLVEGVWKQLGLDRALRKIGARHATSFDFERVVFAMVAHRLADPGSKLAANDWIKDEAWFPDGEGLDVQHFYRALDVLDAHGDDVNDALARAMAGSLTPEDLRLILVDTTSSYFETLQDDLERPPTDPHEEPLRRRGHSKDQQPSAPQVVIGIVSAGSGIPLRYEVYPGNTSDQKITMGLVRQARADLPASRVAVVCDSGMGGGPNLSAMDKEGLDRVSGVPFRSLNFAENTVLAQVEPWQPHPTKPGVTWIAQLVLAAEGTSGRDEWWIATRSEAEARRQQRAIAKHVENVQAELVKDDHADAHGRPTCRVLSKPSLAKYIGAKDGRLFLDYERVAREERFAGVKVVRSTLTDLEPLLSVDAYESLYISENQFRTLKGPLSLRPMYHRAPRRIRAHILVCMLALACLRTIETRTGRPWGQIYKVFRGVQATQIAHGSESHWQRADWSPDARAILDAMKISEGPLILKVEAARSGA